MNGICMHPELRRMAAAMAETDDIYCEQANVLCKCKGMPRDADQAMHCDYGNHTLAYPPDLPAYWQTAYLLYFTDGQSCCHSGLLVLLLALAATSHKLSLFMRCWVCSGRVSCPNCRLLLEALPRKAASALDLHS